MFSEMTRALSEVDDPWALLAYFSSGVEKRLMRGACEHPDSYAIIVRNLSRELAAIDGEVMHTCSVRPRGGQFKHVRVKADKRRQSARRRYLIMFLQHGACHYRRMLLSRKGSTEIGALNTIQHVSVVRPETYFAPNSLHQGFPARQLVGILQAGVSRQ